MPDEKTTLPKPRDLLVRASERGPEETFSHPLNPASQLSGHVLSRRTGLRRCGVNLARLAPGKESFVFHRHWAEEEWVFVISGNATADIGDESFDIGPGDFMGFPPGTHAHHLRNTGTEDLVYLSGGEALAVEVADFPKLGKRLVRFAGDALVYPFAGEKLSSPGE